MARPPLRADGIAIDCGRPHHPPSYAHTCPPQCPSLSPRSGEQCHKDDPHDEWHWIIRDGAIEVWGLPLADDRQAERAPEGARDGFLEREPT